MSGEYGRWVRTCWPSCIAFAWSSQKHEVLRYPHGRLCFLFTWSGCFSWALLSVGLTGRSICWNESFGFLEEVHSRGLPSNPTYIQHHLYRWRPYFGVVGGGLFRLPHYLFHFTLLYSIHFSWPITNCFKNETFSLHSSRELPCRNKVKIFFFPFMWNPNSKVINITKLVQMIFNAWLGYFKYVGYLPGGITLTVLN